MTKVDDGGPAFPVAIGSQHDQYFASPGQSLRDYFAGKALAGYVASSSHPESCGPSQLDEEQTASSCYRFADAMLRARKEGQGGGA